MTRVHQRSGRRGTTLVEILVALPLAMVAAASAAVLLVRVSRTVRTQSAVLATTRELRHARQVIASDVASADGRDLVVVSDTLLELSAHLGVLIVCDGRTPSRTVVTVPYGSAPQWVSGIRPGDALRSWRTASGVGAAPREQDEAVRAALQPLPPAPCGMDGTRSVPLWSVSLADASSQATVGSPMLVRRGVRFQHYRSGTAWWLGRRQRDGVGWDGLQPVAGPLLSAASGGVQLRAVNADGAIIPLAAPLPDSVAVQVAGIEVSLRAPRRATERHARTSDSASVVIALRASAYNRGRP